MSGIDDMILEPLENAFDAMGAMQGEMAPLKRAAIGGAVGYAVLEIFKPGVAYDDAGNRRPFALGADKDTKEGTYFPWWAFVAVPAFVSGVLI